MRRTAMQRVILASTPQPHLPEPQRPLFQTRLLPAHGPLCSWTLSLRTRLRLRLRVLLLHSLLIRKSYRRLPRLSRFIPSLVRSGIVNGPRRRLPGLCNNSPSPLFLLWCISMRISHLGGLWPVQLCQSLSSQEGPTSQDLHPRSAIVSALVATWATSLRSSRRTAPSECKLRVSLNLFRGKTR